MKQSKLEIMPLYSSYDRSGVVRHMEEMAAKGWLVETMNGFYWRYRRTEPQQLRFSITYFPKASQFDPAPAEGLETFWELCAEAGWVLAANNAQIQVFYNEDPDATPIETDPRADFETIHRTMKKSTVGNYWLLLGLSLLESIFLFWQLLDSPVDRLSNPIHLSATFGFIPLFLVSFIDLIRYYRWRKRCRAALETGDPLPELGSARALSILILVLAGLQLISMLGTSLQSSRSMALTLLVMLLFFALMFYLANAVRKWMQKLHAKPWVNLLVTCGVIALLCFGLLGGVMSLVFRTGGSLLDDAPRYETYEVDGFSFREYHDELPLTVQELVPVDYEHWSTQLERNESFLLTHLDARQRSRVGSERLPHLEYEIVIVKTPFLYELCKQDYINWLERDNEKIPEEYWDEYRGVDSAPWGASEVYQRYSSDEAYKQFLVCWPDRIAEIHFSGSEWILTEDIIAAAAEALENAQ